MEIKQLKYFVEVARREHISEAALELNIAQSAISRQITQLEKELHVSLFKRRGRNILLTTEGKQLLEEATKILDQFDKTVQLFQHQNILSNQSIYLSYSESDVSNILGRLVQTFEQQTESLIFPDLSEDETILEGVLAGEIDIGIVELTDQIKHHTNLIMTPLFEEHYYLYSNKNNPITFALQPQLQQLQQENVYCLTALPESIKDKLSSSIRTITDIQLAQYLLKNERGVVITPQTISLDKHSNQWTKVSLSHTELKRTICVIAKKENLKPDLPIALQTIKTLFNKTSTYH
ncbi:glutamate biosynthesis transcriptional regulator GltC [Staphylococcus pasteuri]|uniref:glutamate biosynthesis transcriptional regulator GltC n=1 Tax=Staphylococcus pasteuri TaxID=45972 RepID=UPI0036B801ED